MSIFSIETPGESYLQIIEFMLSDRKNSAGRTRRGNTKTVLAARLHRRFPCGFPRVMML